MPDSPVDYALASEVAAGASAGLIPRSSKFFIGFFFGLLIIHERIQQYIIACHVPHTRKSNRRVFCVRERCCTPTQRPDETESPWHVCSGSYSALRGRSGASEASTTTCKYYNNYILYLVFVAMLSVKNSDLMRM